MAQEKTPRSSSPQRARRVASGIGMVAVVMIVCSFFLPFETGMYTYIIPYCFNGACTPKYFPPFTEAEPFTLVMFGIGRLGSGGVVLLSVLLFFAVVFLAYVLFLKKRPGGTSWVYIVSGLLFLILYLWVLRSGAYRGDAYDEAGYYLHLELIVVSATHEIGWYVTIGGSILLGLSILGVGGEDIVFRLKQWYPTEKVGVAIIARAICRAILISATVGLLLGAGWWLLFDAFPVWFPDDCKYYPPDPNQLQNFPDYGPNGDLGPNCSSSYLFSLPIDSTNAVIAGSVVFTITMGISVVVFISQGKMPFDDRRLSDLKRESPT